MKIKVGKYIINSDKWCWWIEEEYEVTKGKTKGETKTRNVTGYCHTFEKCLNSLIERRIGESEATTLIELLNVLQSVFEDIKVFDEAKFKADMERLKEITE